MLIDITKLHTKKILTINGPMKNFPSKEGVREKFDITFDDGYKAEYCPLVGETKALPHSGQEFTFKVKHRGPKGDEIEPATAEPNRTSPLLPGQVISMGGHPATIALNAALKYHEIVNKEPASKDGEGLLPSEVLDNAEIFLDWLRIRAAGV